MAEPIAAPINVAVATVSPLIFFMFLVLFLSNKRSETGGGPLTVSPCRGTGAGPMRGKERWTSDCGDPDNQWLMWT